MRSYRTVRFLALLVATLLVSDRAPAQKTIASAEAPSWQINPQLVEELVYANRILANEGLVDGFGHVSVREDNHPDRFLMSRSMAPALVTSKDIMEYNLNGDPIDPRGRKSFSERFIHAAIYRARPDVKCVVHDHSLAVIPFSVTGISLRPIFHMSAFLGGGTPIFDIRDAAGDTNMLISNNRLGDALAQALGNHSVALIRGHGAVAAGKSIQEAVFFAYYTDVNARLQAQAMALGNVKFLTPKEAAKSAANVAGQYERAWDLWKERVGKID
jgi:ribulose-5-phosphate 4-epimerase/fuculose-1-phosphate aldolase